MRLKLRDVTSYVVTLIQLSIVTSCFIDCLCNLIVCWELLFNAQGICSTKLNSNSVDYKPPLRITDPIEQLKHRPLWDRPSFIFIYRTKSKVWRYPEINKMNSSRRNSDSSADGIINYRKVLNSATYVINLQHNLGRVLFLLKYKKGS